MDILTSIETVMDSDLLHYGRQGMKWGVRNGPPYPLHPEQLSPAEKKARRSVFISGSSKTQFEDSGYYRKELPKAIQNKIDDYIKDHAHIIVGDAPGIDRQVQDYLNEKGYDAVEIYGPGKQVRYAANDKWKTNPVDAPEFEEMSPEWLRKKDIAMTNDATEGLAIVLDDGAQATRNNVARLREQGKEAEVFILGKDGEDDFESFTGTYTQRSKFRREEKDTTIPAGSYLNRVTGNSNEENKGHVYMSILESDFDIYKKEAAGGIYTRAGDLVMDIYETKHTATADIKVPSFTNAVKAFEKVMTGQNIDAVAKEVGEGFGHNQKEHAEEFKRKFSDPKTVDEAYVDFTTSLGNSEANRKLLFDELRKEGYSAIWDENDRSSGSLRTPLIIFDREENTKQIEAKRLSHADILFAEFVQAEDLKHHGRKGMKWGVRNGPPYPLQYSKMSPEERQKIPRPKLTKKEEAAYKEQIESKEAATSAKRTAAHRKNRMAKVGLNQNEDGSYTLKEGSNIRRVSSEDDDKRSSAKYVSMTSADAKVYDDDVYELGMEEGQTPYTYEFKTKKDLRIANEDDVLDFLLDKYGNDTNRADIEAYQKQRGKDQIYVNAKHGKAEGWLWDYAYGVEQLARTFVHRELYDIDRVHQREVLDHFSSLGYDAIMDIEDRINRFDAPILIIDPGSAMEQTRKEKWEDYNLKKSYKNSLSHSDFLSAVELVLPDDALQYGVLGQKWGIRKWQNKDGTLTPAGRERWINSLKQEAYAASKKWEEYQQVRKQVINMHYEGEFDNELETKMLRLKEEANEAGAIWGSLRKRIESYLENGPDVSTSEPVEDAPHKVLIPVSDEKKYQHFLELGYEEKGRNDTWIYMVNHKKYVKHSDTNQNDVLAAIEIVMDDDIEHSGRKGQKWGIRNGPPYPLQPDQLSARERMLDSSGKKNIAATGERKKWQSSDTLSELASIPYNGLVGGKLTHLGRKHLDKMLSNKELQDFAERNSKSKAYSLKKAGVRKSEQGGSVIGKDTTMQRIADSSDAITDKRKYVSVTSNDQKHYKSIYDKGFLAVKNRDDAAAFKYKGKKELRVADASDVMNYIVDSYGHRKEKKFYSDVKKIEPYRDAFKELYRTGLGSAADLAVANYYDYASFELKRFVKNNLWDGASETGKQTYAKNKQKEILNHYKELGYDAIADVEDVLSGYEYPIILINPSESIRLSKKEKLSHSELYLAHYRRGGEKKGVRRWQNYDGSLTPAGREHYGIGPPREAKAEDPERAALSKSGIHKQNAQTDIIVGGTKFVRQASAKDDQYHDRKYMSVTKKDVDYWRGEQEAEYTYEAKRNLKVANAQAVVDYIVQDMMGYGQSEEGKKLSSLYEKYRGNTWDHFFEKRSNKKERAQMWKVIAKQRSAYGREGATDSHRQILDHFSQLGYDAMVDINQSWQGMEYPIIVIDPDDSTKLVTKLVRRS